MAAASNEGKTRIPFAKCSNAFNADQIDGLPDEFYVLPEPARDHGTETNPELEAFFARTGAEMIRRDEPRGLLLSSFRSDSHAPDPYVYKHRPIFWDFGSRDNSLESIDKRLGRNRTQKTHAERAREEMCAEIGACILGVILSIEPDFEQSTAYVASWLEALKTDKALIFKAAPDAQKAMVWTPLY